jgi:hypothetical protein
MPTGRRLLRDHEFRSNGLWARQQSTATPDQALPLSLFRTHGSQDLDTLWNSSCPMSKCEPKVFVRFLDDEFGRGLSISRPIRCAVRQPIELHPTIKDKWGRPVAYVIETRHPMTLSDGQDGGAVWQLLAGGDPIGRNYPVRARRVYTWPRTLARWPTILVARAWTDPRACSTRSAAPGTR